MAGKKFDLGSYKTDTTKTQVKHNKYSDFYKNEDNYTDENDKEKKVENEIKNLFSPEISKKSSAPDISETGRDPTEIHTSSKRINMAFSDTNYEFLTSECERLSVSFVYLVNSMIETISDDAIERYIGSMKICRSKDNVMRRKGKPAKRINLKFNGNLHNKLNMGSTQYNMTITQYMNTIIEVYAQDRHNLGT